MRKTKRMKIQQLFDLEPIEFAQTVSLGFLESQPGRKASADDLLIVANWAQQALTDALLLEMFFEGNATARVTDGKLEFRSTE
jgi:hypothetical protein